MVHAQRVQSGDRLPHPTWPQRVGLARAPVRGRTSGEWRSTPVNLLTLDDDRYLVAPRGQTQWVKNLRVSGTGELRVGRKVEPFEATELADDDKTEVLRAYLKRWKMEVGVFFGGVDGNSSEEDLQRIAPDHPVFVIRRAGGDIAQRTRPASPVDPATFETMIVVVAALKGGVGKTTTAVYLAALAAGEPEVRDPGRRRTRKQAARTGSRPRRTTSSRRSRAVEAPTDRLLSRALSRIDGDEVAVVDTPPGNERLLAKAIDLADVVVVPTRVGGVENARVEAVVSMVPINVPLGLVICSARTYTLDYQEAVATWTAAAVPLWGSVPERVSIAGRAGERAVGDGLDAYRGVWRRAVRAAPATTDPTARPPDRQSCTAAVGLTCSRRSQQGSRDPIGVGPAWSAAPTTCRRRRVRTQLERSQRRQREPRPRAQLDGLAPAADVVASRRSS